MKYSITIRTLGKGGECWERLVESINSQTLLPEKVFVVLPEDIDRNNLPTDKIVNCVPLFTRKGMMHQRVYGLEQAEKLCDSDFILCLDDDVEFPVDFAQKCLDIININGADLLAPCVVRPGEAPFAVPKSFSLSVISDRLLGSRIVSKKSKYRIQVVDSAGYRINPWLRGTFPTQSCNGPGFWLRNGVQSKLDYKSEYWIEGCRYPLPEDQLFGYKAWLSGLKTLYSNDVILTHLDAKSTITSDRQYFLGEARGRNFLIFWHRLMKPQSNGFWRCFKSSFAINCSLFFTGLAYVLYGFVKRDMSAWKGFNSGLKSARGFLKSEEYKSLPKIVHNTERV